MKYKILLLALCLAFSSSFGEPPKNHSPLQTPCYDTLTFGLQSLDTDSLYFIKLYPDNYDKTATVLINRANFLKFHNIERVDSIIGQNQHFTEIQFRLAGDPAAHKMRTILFCIAKGKLHASLDFFSNESAFKHGVIDSVRYHVSIEVGSDGNNPVATLRESRFESPDKDSTHNTLLEQTYHLTFDDWNFIFYDSLLQMNDKYTLASSTDSTRIDIKEKVPTLKLWYPERYYFINGVWYVGLQDTKKLMLRE